MASNLRTQLTLFVEESEAETIEKVRKEFNPLQSEIIKSHVTLCREDEIRDLEKLINNLKNLRSKSLTIQLGKIERFDKGRGVFIPAKEKNNEFQNLRKLVLKGLVEQPRNQLPHITLIHPRNATCTDDIYKQLEKVIFPTQLTFKKIYLIEQEGVSGWKIAREFELNEGID